MKTMKTMKTIQALAIVVLFIGFTTSCDSDDDVTTPAATLESKTISNLAAPQTGGQGQGAIGGPFTKFDFSTGLETTSDTEWDIAFRGLRIAVNGGVSTGTADEPVRNGDAGVYVVRDAFSNVTTVNETIFTQDSSNGYAVPFSGDDAWYNYDSSNFIVSTVPGRTLIFRTRDGKYAKVEIISYYLDNPMPIVGGFSPDASTPRYYTFNYVYNPNEGDTSF